MLDYLRCCCSFVSGVSPTINGLMIVLVLCYNALCSSGPILRSVCSLTQYLDLIRSISTLPGKLPPHQFPGSDRRASLGASGPTTGHSGSIIQCSILALPASSLFLSFHHPPFLRARLIFIFSSSDARGRRFSS